VLLLIGTVFLVLGVVLARDAWLNRFRYGTDGGWSPEQAHVRAWGFEEVGDGLGPVPVMEPQYWVEVEVQRVAATPRRFRQCLAKSATVNTPQGRRKAGDLEEGDQVTAWLIPDGSSPPTIAPTAGPAASVPILISFGVLVFGLLMFLAGVAAL
jgi:hypothetical protein